MRRYGLRPNKALGQHFLVDGRVLARIVEAVAGLGPAHVVELGPGAGALTFRLLDRGWPVKALEIDRGMLELLGKERGEAPLELVEADLANTDFVAHLPAARPVAFAGNLPYQVTSPVLFGLLPALRQPGVVGGVFMVQSEVATRMAAPPGTRDYGILSVLLQAELDIERLFVVKPGSFAPPPGVDSAVVRVVPKAEPVPLGEPGTKLVKELFAERRKQVGGLLRRRYGLDAGTVERALAEAGVEARARAEQLDLGQFLALSRALPPAGDAA